MTETLSLSVPMDHRLQQADRVRSAISWLLEQLEMDSESCDRLARRMVTAICDHVRKTPGRQFEVVAQLVHGELEVRIHKKGPDWCQPRHVSA